MNFSVPITLCTTTVSSDKIAQWSLAKQGFNTVTLFGQCHKWCHLVFNNVSAVTLTGFSMEICELLGSCGNNGKLLYIRRLLKTEAKVECACAWVLLSASCLIINLLLSHFQFMLLWSKAISCKQQKQYLTSDKLSSGSMRMASQLPAPYL